MHEMRNCHARKERIRIIQTILSGKYRIIDTLGCGSTSTVYLAEHLKLNTLRAIKCIPKSKACGNSLSLESCPPTEAAILKDLNHPGIPLIFDIDEDASFVYIIEEFIPGESLDDFFAHQENISQELIIKVGIELCDILDYLHHLSPYPILYQDLKPEHIIVCGNQIKLIDFGIASFFTGSGKIFQIYGTDGFAAPEAVCGSPIGPEADIYSLGKVLLYLAEKSVCSARLLRTLQKAAAVPVTERFETVSELKSALAAALPNACQNNPHLIKSVAVLGSRTGAGATHFAVSLVCTLNKLGCPALYAAWDADGTLPSIQEANRCLQETEGIFQFGHFKGIPRYGNGVRIFFPADHVLIKDYGMYPKDITELEAENLIIFVMSGSDWDFSGTLAVAEQFRSYDHAVFVCGFGNKKAAKKYAHRLGVKLYCFPFDADPYAVTAEKERLVRSIFHWKGGKRTFFSARKKEPEST